LRYLAVHVPLNNEGDRLTNRSTFPEHVHARQILRIETQLDAPTDRDGSTAWSGPWLGKASDGRLARLGVLARVAHLLGPGQESIVQLGEAGDAVRLGLGEKTFADEAIEALLLAAPLG
jgi:hypothetical protein